VRGSIGASPGFGYKRGLHRPYFYRTICTSPKEWFPMPKTPAGHFQRNKKFRFGYGIFNNYRLASVTRGIPNADASKGASVPTSGESLLDVVNTAPAAAGDPTIDGRGSWPAPGAGGMSSVRPEGGLAVSYTAVVEGIGPGLYPRVDPASTPINATVDVSIDPGDGTAATVTTFGGSVAHRYSAGTWTPKLVVTDQLGRVSTQEFATGDITVTGDVAAPAFTAGPTAVAAPALKINTGFTSNDNGTVYVVVVPNGDPAPSVAEVMAGTASGGAAAEASGTRVVVATTPATLTGLAPTSGSGDYDVYFVLYDGTHTQAGAPTSVLNVPLRPEFTAGPTAVDGGSLGFDFTFTADTDCTIYVVVVPTAAPAPTPAEVRAGTASGGGVPALDVNTALTAGVPASILGPVPTTGAGTYDVYFALWDGANYQTAAPDVVAAVDIHPSFSIGPAVATAPALTIDTTFTVDNDGDVYAVVVPNGAAAPTPAEVVAGTASGGGAAEANGTVAVLAGVGNTIAGLAPTSGSGDYDVYMVIVAGGVYQTGAPFVALDVELRPEFSAGPTAVPAAGLTIDTGFTSDTNGDVYVVVVPAGDPAPTPAEVVAGTASGGGAAEDSDNVAVVAGVANVIAGLTPTSGSGDYDVYFALYDGTHYQTVAPTLIPGVAVRPEFSAGPTAVPAAGLTIDTGFTSDTNGDVYVVVVPAGDPAPTPAEVVAGTASGGGVAEDADTVAVVAGVPGVIVGLTPTSGSGDYDVYFVLDDGTNYQTGAPDVVATVAVRPEFSAGPTAIDGGALDIDTGFTSDTNGDVYVVVVPAGAVAPTPAEVVAGTASGGGAAEADGTVAVLAGVPGVIAGLTPTSGAGDYDVYFVLDDGTNYQTGAPDVVAAVVVRPNFTAGPTAIDGGGTDIDTTFTSDSDGTVYIVVVPNADPAPNAAEIIAGTASGGGAAEAADNEAVLAGVGDAETLVPTGGAGAYDVYFIIVANATNSAISSVINVVII